MGVPLTGPLGGHQTAQYQFNVDSIVAQYVSQRDSAKADTEYRQLHGQDSALMRQIGQKERLWAYWVAALPDPRDARVDPDRLHVIAFIQDLDTGEILQATQIALGKQAENAAATATRRPNKVGRGE